MQTIDLKHLQQLTQIIAEEAFMGFCTFEILTRECVFLNKRARELFEITDQDADFNLRLDQIFATEARGDFRAFNEDLIAHEGLYQDIVLRRANGHTFVANVGVKRLKINNQLSVLLMIQDVTLQKKLQREVVVKQIEIKKAYEELLGQNQQLKELDLAKNRFIALTTHELRTPLAAMVASAEILHMGLYDTEAEMKDFIKIVFEQGQHLHELVDDILDFAKIQAGRMDFYIEEKDPFPLVQSVVDGFQGMADVTQIAIEIKQPIGPVNCFFDEMRLRQVISNIVNNAIKYNRDSGKIAIWTEVLDDKVKICIRDTGHGIATDLLPKVFDEFETLGQVAQHHKGTGLGMPISRRLMEGMGGTVQVVSELGKGSTFWVEIPTTKILSNELYRARTTNSSGDVAA